MLKKENDSEWVNEMELHWEGKEETIRLSKSYTGNMDIVRMEGKDTDRNLFLAADNAAGLHFLNKMGRKKADLVYIDPPYRNYHTSENQWLNDIYLRLTLAAEWMEEDALICISINDCFQAQLRLLCNEIFGARNFVAQVVRKRTENTPEHAVVVSRVHEYVIIYAKNIEEYLKLHQGMPPVSTWWENEGYSEDARADLYVLIGHTDFQVAKPVKLIKKCIQFCPKKDAVILDFYAGSGTTAQAVLELNKEDGGSRSFVLIQREEAENGGESIVNLARKRIHAVDSECEYSFYCETRKNEE